MLLVIQRPLTIIVKTHVSRLAMHGNGGQKPPGISATFVSAGLDCGRLRELVHCGAQTVHFRSKGVSKMGRQFIHVMASSQICRFGALTSLIKAAYIQHSGGKLGPTEQG